MQLRLALPSRPGALLRLAACAAALASADVAHAAGLTAREEVGKRIFLTGESPSGAEITAVIGQDGTPLPATSLPCGSCHGEDGTGRAEGGANPGPVIWSELTKTYGHVHADGRRHPRFDAQSLARAVRDGVDPAGNPLDLTMPRYVLSAEDLESLTAYLRRLEGDIDPGIGPDELRIGTVLPTRGALAATGREMRSALEARLAAVNATGGLHGRRLRLVVEGYDSDGGPAAAAVSARRLVEGGRVFALVSGFSPAAEQALWALADRARVPLVGPFTLFGSQPDSPSPWVFHLLAGVREQGRVLADFAAARSGTSRPPVAILHPRDPLLAEAAAAAGARFAAKGFEAVEVIAFTSGRLPASLADELKASGTKMVLYLGDDSDLAALTRAAGAADWAPYLLVPGGLAARAAVVAPAAFQHRIFLAVPTLPSDEKGGPIVRLAALDASGGAGHRAARIAADSAARVLTEGLRRAGRSLSRRALVESLEGLYRFDAGLLPSITYGPNRRVGALGAYVVVADVEAHTLHPVGGWQPLE